MRAYYELLTAHPHLLTPGLIIRGAVPAGARLAERALLLVEVGGLAGERGYRAVSTLTSFVAGAAINAVWSNDMQAEGEADADAYDAATFPRVKAVLENANVEQAFESGLAFIIGALTQLQ
jgi:hypothetical protein